MGINCYLQKEILGDIKAGTDFKKKKIVLPKKKGGVNIKKLDLVNKALHVKWRWRYKMEKDELRKTIIPNV